MGRVFSVALEKHNNTDPFKKTNDRANKLTTVAESIADKIKKAMEDDIEVRVRISGKHIDVTCVSADPQDPKSKISGGAGRVAGKD